MRLGEIITIDQLNRRFLRLYRFLNDLVPAKAFSLTTGQIIHKGITSTTQDGRQYPSKYGFQFFADDATGLLTDDIIEKMRRALGE